MLIAIASSHITTLVPASAATCSVGRSRIRTGGEGMNYLAVVAVLGWVLFYFVH
jgi:hypothetical protein